MKKLDFIFVCFCFITLSFFGVLFVSSKEKNYSKEEDKLLIKKPNITLFSLTSYDKIHSLEQFYQEQFSYRNIFLELETYLNIKIGIHEKNEVYLGKNDYLFEKVKKIESADSFVDKLNLFYKKHNNLNMSLLLLPSHASIYFDQEENIYDEYEDIKNIYHKITFNTIDVFDTLKEGMREYEMYYKTDSHLTSYGAYYVYLKYAEDAFLSAYFIDDFDVLKISDNFTGNLIKKAHTFSMKKDTITKFVSKRNVTLEIESNQQKLDSLYCDNALNGYMYSYFLGENKEMVIKNSDGKGEILVVKDDSGNVIIPFLTNHYYKVHVLDIDSYQDSISTYLEKEGEIKEVLFLLSAKKIDDL